MAARLGAGSTATIEQPWRANAAVAFPVPAPISTTLRAPVRARTSATSASG
jgi:hypothetical protein